ncbi:beta-glucoside-specific PTS transporter subunit IIABC [Celerinatantimonas yamalensis]|uniref:Beta-glucoside-specific PTS transporter subunit IIABC n=1 Tax=Celerinatantimonas yamalensis TaxID=559956 RepID=A0ABW9G6P0_9GAMM
MATAVRNYAQLARDILEEIGGEENLSSFSRCATRLRLIIKSIPEHAAERIKSMPGVITVIISGGQFQVVVGTHVSDLYQEMSQLVDQNKLNDTGSKQSVINAMIATMSAIFAPIIYVLASAGILQGLLILAKLAAPSFEHTSTYSILNFMSWTPFTFLPIFIAVTASKHFKCNPYIAVLCCAALINPEWGKMAAQIAQGHPMTFLFFPLAKTVYTASVLPPIFLVWLLSYLQHYLERVLPNIISTLFSPLLCMVIMVPLTLVLIGPITTDAAMWIAHGYNWLYDAFPPLAAAIIGGFWQVIVIFGIHWGITPVVFANYAVYGHDSFQAYQTIAVIAQMAAAFACAMRTRNKLFRATALSAGVTGIFGITEPAIYGVTLRLKKPFICGCIGGALGAIVTSLFGSYYYVFAGLPGILTMVNAISSTNPMSFIGELAGAACAIVTTFILIYSVGFDDPKSANESDKSASAPLSTSPKPAAIATSADASQPFTLLSPAQGQLIALTQVNDDGFSQKMLGDGIAIYPSEGQIIAPCDAIVMSVIDSQHAVGLICDNGAELLIHVGLDTVKLNGQHFNTRVAVGDSVKAGDLLIEFDLSVIANSGYDLTTPFIILNSDDYQLDQLTTETATFAQPLMQLSEKHISQTHISQVELSQVQLSQS